MSESRAQARLKKVESLNEEMSLFIRGLIQRSDDIWKGNRQPDTERRYKIAIKLVAKAEKLAQAERSEAAPK